MIPTFISLLEQALAAHLSLSISVFYTRAIPDSESALQGLEVLPAGLTLSPGRPHLKQMLEGVVGRTCDVFRTTGSEVKPSGVFVGACGPAALTEEAGNVVRNFDRETFYAVGGVEAQEEYEALSMRCRVLMVTPSDVAVDRNFSW